MMIREFLNYLQFERNYSARTVKEYGADLKEFELYFKNLDAHLSWESVDSDVIRDWMESMMDKGNSASSVNRRLSALRSFFRFALSRNLVGSDPAHGLTGPKKNKPLPQFVKESEMDELLDCSMWNLSDYKDMCARTIIMTFYETGVRAAELIGLDDAMVDLEACQLKVTGKRNKQRIIPFGQELRDALSAYMELRDKVVTRLEPALFVSAKGRRLTYPQVRVCVTDNLARVSSLKKTQPARAAPYICYCHA